MTDDNQIISLFNRVNNIYTKHSNIQILVESYHGIYIRDTECNVKINYTRLLFYFELLNCRISVPAIVSNLNDVDLMRVFLFDKDVSIFKHIIYCKANSKVHLNYANNAYIQFEQFKAADIIYSIGDVMSPEELEIRLDLLGF